MIASNKFVGNNTSIDKSIVFEIISKIDLSCYFIEHGITIVKRIDYEKMNRFVKRKIFK